MSRDGAKLRESISAAWESADGLAVQLLGFDYNGPDVSGRLGELVQRSQSLYAFLHEVWKENRGK